MSSAVDTCRQPVNKLQSEIIDEPQPEFSCATTVKFVHILIVTAALTQLTM